MTTDITDDRMSSDTTQHIAHRVAESMWELSWLPGRLVTRTEAVTGMTLAEAVVALQDGAQHQLWPHIDNWAAELGLTGPDAVARISETSPRGDL